MLVILIRFATLLALLSVAPSAHVAGVAERWTPAPIAGDQYESSPTFSADGREMFFMRSDPSFSTYRLLWSKCENGRWSSPTPPPFAAAAPVQEADPFLSPDGRRLYFVSSRHDPSGEDLDIHVVERDGAGRWGGAQRLPSPVNSQASELLPRFDRSGRLYFGSSREGGLGKSDIYRATPLSDGKWKVENLGAPVNSAGNEYEAEVSGDAHTLIVVADRGDRSHLYRYEWRSEGWVERDRLPANDAVFQVGPVLSPRADRLLFAQADAERSGEMFVIDLVESADRSWPPSCRQNHR